MEADLMFEVLLYLNIYYFPVFSVAETFVVCAKYISNELRTPWIGNDAAVVGSILLSEFLKLILYQRMKDQRRAIANVIAIFFTHISFFGILYIFVLQSPVLKIEYMICIMMFMLLVCEIVYGFLQYCKCCKKPRYV